MKPLGLSCMPLLNSQFKRFFPLDKLKALWQEVEPRRYARKLEAASLVQSFLIAFAAQLSGLRAVVERCQHLLKTDNFSAVSHALSRASSWRLVARMIERLATRGQPREHELIALDSMAVSLSKTQRHRCAKMNDNTVGGGVLWAFRLRTRAGESPVEVLKLTDGAWHDSCLMAGVLLLAKGPVYLMDRGFYALALLANWQRECVRFIVRVKKSSLVYTELKTLSLPRRIGKLRLLKDVWVRLGGERAMAHPEVRLLIAVLPSGEELILATGLRRQSAAWLFAAYKQRWKIERFHRFLKDTLGLAHLYSFHQNGLKFLLLTALLLALLLYLAQEAIGDCALAVFQQALKALRRVLGLGTRWRRNTYARGRKKIKQAAQNP